MIKFHEVSLIYPNSAQTIIEDLSFQVEEGEFVLVIGHTGAGKSSILRLINGLVPHHTGGILSGEIEVAGRSTRLLKPGQLADIVGIVGQNPINGFVCEIVEDEIAFTLETLGMPREAMRKRVEEVLDLLALNPLRRREISTLSGGEQQRVAIAAALVTQPKVLLLDEPTSALDPIAAEDVLSILHRLVHDLGLTVVLAEHRLERVIQFADRILLIRGEQTEIGQAREILARSPIAPPLVELARAVGAPEIALSIREFRKNAPEISPRNGSNSARSGQPLAALERVCAAYETENGRFALRDISLEIVSGEVVALMGRNGAGKSTLLRSLVGLAPITSGSVYVIGKDPTKFNPKELIHSVGYVPQEPSDLLISDSVYRECHQADLDNQVPAGTTLDIYRSIMTVSDEHAHPRDLSEGQRLGLALSICLSAQPKLIVMDEPTRGLDYEAKRALVAQLTSIAAQGRAVLLATHDVELVAELADRVIFIADGELIADGEAREVLLSSPAFAPQVAKAFPNHGWLTVKEISEALKR